MPDGIAPKGYVIASIAGMYVDFCESQGLPRAQVLAASGLDETALAQVDGYVPDRALFALWAQMVTQLGHECRPVAIGRFWEPHRMGLIAELMRHAPNARRVYEQVGRFDAIVDPNVRSEVVVRGDCVGLLTRHLPEVHALGLPIEVMVAIHFRMLAWAVGDLQLERVTFSHSARYPSEPYEAFYGAPVVFGADVDGLWIPVQELDRPFVRRDERVFRYLHAFAVQMLDTLPAPSGAALAEPSVIDRVREALAEELGLGEVDRERIARRLAMSERTLQRRLAEAGTSFQTVLDEVRRKAAEQLLVNRRVSILEAVFALGYQNAASFYKAFRRWHGVTPQRWREQAIG